MPQLPTLDYEYTDREVTDTFANLFTREKNGNIAMPRVKICDAVGKEDRRYRGTQQAAILALFGPVSRCVPSA